MKVIQINTFSYKAAGNIMMNIHNTMLKEGIESYVVWGRGRKAINEHEYYLEDDLGVKIHGIYTRITDRHGFSSKKSTRKLLEWMDTIKPDYIHLHCIHGYYINIEMLFLYIKKNNIKVVWTQHDCWSFTGHCAYFDVVGCEKWKEGCYDCKQLSTYPASIILDNSKWNWRKKRELFLGVDMKIIAPCNWLADIIKDSFLGSYSIEVIYNGIDTSIFKHNNSYFKKNYGIEGKKVVLGVAGEWTERKGLRDFVELNKFLDDEKYVIVVVGVTEKQKKELPNNIIAIKRTEDVHELVDIYSAADVYFNPTYEDNFPTTNLEALACGTPVITYDTGGSVESIGANGFIVNQGDIAKVLECLSSINKIGNVTFNPVFTIESMNRSYIELYKNEEWKDED